MLRAAHREGVASIRGQTLRSAAADEVDTA